MSMIMPKAHEIQLVFQHPGDDDETVYFEMESPTQGSNARIRPGFRREVVRAGFKTPSGRKVSAAYDYYWIGEITFDWHYMNLLPLWLADKIIALKLPFDLNYGNGSHTYECRLADSHQEIWKEWFEGMAVLNQQALSERDQIPNASITLRFEGVEPISREDLLAIRFNRPVYVWGDDGEIISGLGYLGDGQAGGIFVDAFDMAEWGNDTQETFNYNGQEFTINFAEVNIDE